MSKKILRFGFVVAVALGTHVTLIAPASAQTVQSLRGIDVEEQDAAPGAFRLLPDSDPFKRDFVQQPPLIPHKVEGYEVTINFNKCMDCHSWARYKEMKATKVSLTHFMDRDGGEHSNISPRRYFCLQCHVPQTDAPQLVENRFKPATGVR